MRLHWTALFVSAAVWAAADVPLSKAPQQGQVAVSGSGGVLPGSASQLSSAPSRAAVRASSATPPRTATPVTLLGSAATASPAQAFALNGNVAYVCDVNEVTVVDITSPSQLTVVTTALSDLIKNSGNIHCAIQRSTLTVFADQSSSTLGNTPGFSAFALTNPSQPQLIKATPISKRFFQDPVYLGNYAFVPTAAVVYWMGFEWDGQYGDLVAVDLANFSSPTIAGTLAQPQVSTLHGGASPVFGATHAGGALLYIGGSTSTGAANNGLGRLQIVDVTDPAAMKIIGQLLVPGTVHLRAPQIQATVAVSIGNTGGFVGDANALPSTKGNIVVATFDVTNRRAPKLLATLNTAYKVGNGAGATRIGTNLFAYAGVADAAGNPVLLVVDVTNPAAPAVESIPLSQPITSMEASGSILYATLGAGGFAAYSIPGVSTVTSACPAAVDAILLVDRATSIPAQNFADGKTALKSIVDTLFQSTDQLGVISFNTAAATHQPLTTGLSGTKTVIDSLSQNGVADLAAGIAAAQAELASVRHSPSAMPVIFVLSDGANAGAANSTAAQAAATAAKAAGIRIVSLQFGATINELMRSIASSAGDFHLLAQ